MLTLPIFIRPISQPEEDVDAINVAAVQSDRMSGLRGSVLETQEVIGHLGWSSHFTGTVQTQNQKVHNKSVVLYNE